MKRDMELIRKLVLALEACDGFAPAISVEGYTPQQIGYHSHLMGEAGLAHVSDATNFESVGPMADLMYLTWEGHEFADAARDENRWNKAKDLVKDKAGAVTVGVFTQLLTWLAKSSLGIP
jgi:hypothetical protein